MGVRMGLRTGWETLPLRACERGIWGGGASAAEKQCGAVWSSVDGPDHRTLQLKGVYDCMGPFSQG